jgi:DNA transformation protein
MAVSNAFIDEAKDLFSPFGEIRVRRMFGGAGVYCDDLFFALLDDGVVYLKADDASRKAFEVRGLSPFSYEGKDGKVGVMAYYNAPEEIFDDADALREWATRALDAAKRAAKFKKKK